MKTEYMLVGEVLRPQGIHGEAKLQAHAADPGNFLRWKTLYRFVAGQYVPVGAKCSRVGSGFAYVTLDGCAAPEDVDRLRGEKLYIERAQADELSESGSFIADLIGCEAVDGQGVSLGVLQDVLQYGTVDTWVFKSGVKTWMAPALLRVFTQVDVEAGRITVDRDALNEVAVFED